MIDCSAETSDTRFSLVKGEKDEFESVKLVVAPEIKKAMDSSENGSFVSCTAFPTEGTISLYIL
jgi:hypothetical protein